MKLGRISPKTDWSIETRRTQSLSLRLRYRGQEIPHPQSSTGTDGNSLDFFGPQQPQRELAITDPGFNTRSSVVDHHDGRFLVVTDIDAPTYRLAGISASNTSDWVDIIPASEHLLEGVRSTGGQLFATYLKNACNAVVRMDMDGSNPREIALPNAAGTAGGFGGKIGAKETFYAFTSFTYPTSIYRYDLPRVKARCLLHLKLILIQKTSNRSKVWYESKDGTQVPMFIVHKKGLELTATDQRTSMRTADSTSA